MFCEGVCVCVSVCACMAAQNKMDSGFKEAMEFLIPIPLGFSFPPNVVRSPTDIMASPCLLTPQKREPTTLHHHNTSEAPPVDY